MFEKLLMLAQEAAETVAPVATPIDEVVPESPIWNLRNLVLVLAIFAVLIIYKVYRDRVMK
jgi:hypothetical protein